MIRKTVTLVFCDVTGSTALGEALDPEAVRGVMSRYFETARAVLERHGGTVEKFVGDAVMAAFGIPVVHEDDAVRAVRAAVELRGALRVLNVELERDYGVEIAVRMGVNTGEVVAGDPSLGQDFATGDAVVLTQRLESVAAPNEILLGDATYRIVRDAVTVESLPPLELKGRAAPSGAWRLLGSDDASTSAGRHLDAPLVGRRDELGRLVRAFRETVVERGCRVLTVLGDAGVGKSRLVAELVREVAAEAQVLEGRCLPYGRGITYWPVAEIVRAAAEISTADSVDAAREKIDALLDDEPDSALVAARVADAAGLGESGARSEELSWAVRRLLETLARQRPLLIVIDDVQWAEATLLDMVEYLAGWTRDAPILLCCLARPDLLDVRPAWHDAAEIRLEPLEQDEARHLVANALGTVEPRAVDEIVRLAEGNPLFVEEIVLMLVDDGSLVRRGDTWSLTRDASGLRVPATIQAVLAARLDSLSGGELAILQHAAVIGHEFWWGAVTQICPDEERPHVAGLLHALVRRQLVQPHPSTLAGEDSFRFGHILVRDSAYESIPKRRRADLHERFAGWIESRVTVDLRSDEILGYHLEQAYRYRAELGPVDTAGRALAGRASERLAVAGRRALGRGDGPAAVNLLGRAARLVEDGRFPLMLDLAIALRDVGDLDAARRALDGAGAEAATEADESLIEVERAYLAFYTDPAIRFDSLLEAARRAVTPLRLAHDDEGLVRALTLEAYVHFTSCRVGAMEEALHRVLVHAERSGDRHGVTAALVGLGRAAVVGPTAVDAASEQCREILGRNPGSRWLEGVLLSCLAYLEAMAGRADESRELYRASQEILEELGNPIALGGARTYAGAAEMLAGDPVAAELELRKGLGLLEAIHETGNLSTIAAVLADALLAQGRGAEADELTRMSESAASVDDATSQVGWRAVRAKVRGREGDIETALRLAGEAVAIAEATDSPNLRGDAHAARATVLELAGRSAEADAAKGQAGMEYGRKGNVAAVRALRSASTVSLRR